MNKHADFIKDNSGRGSAFPRTASVLLDLVTRQDTDGRGTQVFAQLQAVDLNAVHVCVNKRESREMLQDLLWMIGEQNFRGVLFVLLPDVETGASLTRRFTISGWSTVTAEQVNQDAEGFYSRFQIENSIGLADRYAERGGLSVILFTEAPALGDSVSFVKLAPSKLANVDLFETLLAPSKSKLVPVGVRAINNLIDPNYFLEGCGGYAIRPIERYQEWLHQEFETEECAEAAIDLLRNVFATEISPKSRLACLPRSWQIAIGSIRLARQMAAWTLEGDAFRCSILLMSGMGFQRFIRNEDVPLTRVLNFNSPVPFHLENQRAVRDMAELSQADDLFLTVSATDGCLHMISGFRERSEKESRHLRYARLARKSHALLLHIRDAFVEVYGYGRLWLWHDRFRWVVQPFETLREALKDHFSGHVHEGDDPSDLLIGAIASLMDQHQASIIVLLHDRDIDAFNNRISDLRPTLAVSEHLQVSGMPVDTLTSILHIDGAHAIRNDGRLSHLAKRIQIPVDSKITESLLPKHSGSSRSGFTGTGTQAAEELSRILTNSCVIKVSASGYIKFFDEKRRY